MSSPIPNLEPIYVVDTHALVWYLLGSQKLSVRAKTIFQAAEQNQTIFDYLCNCAGRIVLRKREKSVVYEFFGTLC
jgi:predicted SprT family Zn-dependent metalloprotease